VKIARLSSCKNSVSKSYRVDKQTHPHTHKQTLMKTTPSFLRCRCAGGSKGDGCERVNIQSSLFLTKGIMFTMLPGNDHRQCLHV